MCKVKLKERHCKINGAQIKAGKGDFFRGKKKGSPSSNDWLPSLENITIIVA
jgi:hypothetical protein